MDNNLFQFIGETKVPKLNPLLANGIAVEHLKEIESQVDKILRSAAEGFPEGLRYLGMEHCTPEKEFHETLRRKNNKRFYEIARSDIYMVRCIYEWKTEKIHRHLYLIYPRDAGLVSLLGATFSISGVLNDNCISVGLNDIFVPLTCTKLTFERLIHHFYLNGTLASEFVVWSTIYRVSAAIRAQGKPTIKANSTLAHYLFCKYGLKTTFRMYANANVVVGTTEEINSETHPPAEWFICTTTKINYMAQAQDICLAIKKADWSPLVAGLVAGFFYVVDTFPGRIRPEYIEESISDSELGLWRILIGHVIFARDVSEGKLLVDIDAHMEYLDGYIDVSAKEDLASAGVYVDDFYQLLVHMIETFGERIMGASETIGNMYGKRLSVLRYICMPITTAAFNLMFRLRKMAGKPNISTQDIINTMNKFLKTDLIISINRDHGEVKPVSSSSDNKAFNITSAIVPQAQSNGLTNAKTKASLLDPGRQLHASIAEVGSLTHLPKSDPTGRNRINLCAKVGADGTIIRDPAKIALIDSVQEKIKR